MSEIQNMINNREICGKELILDIHNVEPFTLTKESIESFLTKLCEEINMERTELYCWEYLEDPTKDPEEFKHLKGYSFVQFIKTSNVTIHTFDLPCRVSLNIFSCKDFNQEEATKFCKDWFKGDVIQDLCILRY